MQNTSRIQVSESIKHATYYELAVCLRGNVHHYLVRQFKKDGLFGIEDGNPITNHIREPCCPKWCQTS